MISALRNFIINYAELEQTALLNVEYLPSTAINYTIVEEPVQEDGIIRSFVGGAKLKEHRFRLLRTTHYEQPSATNISNSTFMRDFEAWINSQNNDGQLPSIAGIQDIRITSKGRLEAVADDQSHAVYGVGLGIRYIEE